MKAQLSFIACILFLFPFQVSIGQNYQKNRQSEQRETEIKYQPVEEAMPINDINTGSGGYADCFYYGDPSGMYLEKDWQDGLAVLKDGSNIEGLFRYNLYSQKMEAIVDGDTFAFAQPVEVEMIRIGDQEFRYCTFTRESGELSASWFECLTQGECSLFLRRFIKYRVADGDGDPTNDQLYRLEEYYTCRGESSLTHLHISKKSVLSELGEHQKLLKSFMKKENIKLKEQDDLIHLFAFYNDLK